MTAQRLDINSRTTDRGVSWTGNIPLDPSFFADGQPHSLTSFRALLADDDNPAELYIEIDGPLLGPNIIDFHNLSFTLSSELGSVEIEFISDTTEPYRFTPQGAELVAFNEFIQAILDRAPERFGYDDAGEPFDQAPYDG